MSDVTFRLRHNLALLLRDRGLTAAQLSRKTGIAKQVLSDWLSGVQPRKIEHLYAVAKVLGVSMDLLCFAQPEAEMVGNAQGFKGAGHGDLEGLFGQTQTTPGEIKGRFEIYMRRIADD
jgi:transcriptional regulator with XRE-family HTH domain